MKLLIVLLFSILSDGFQIHTENNSALSYADLKTLNCQCNDCEDSPNNTCITDGLCYAEAHSDNGKISYIYGCLPRNQFLPPEEMPFVCREKHRVQCCFSNYCNRDLQPSLPQDITPLLPIFKCDQDGVSPNPRSCESFIKCSHHLKYVMQCPKGLHFSNATGQCETPCDAMCDQNLACECGWKTCFTVCEEPNEIYAHPDNCKKFVKCDDGKPTVFECSRSKTFNVNKKKCTLKSEVGCNKNVGTIISRNEIIHL